MRKDRKQAGIKKKQGLKKGTHRAATSRVLPERKQEKKTRINMKNRDKPEINQQ